MAEGHVEINGNGYVLLPFTSRGRTVTLRDYVFKQTVETTTTLSASPDSRGRVVPVKFNIPFRGCGRKRIARNKEGRIDPIDFDRIWFSKFINTIWPTQTTLQLGATSVSSAVSHASRRLKASAHFKSNFYTLWEGETAGFAPTIHISPFSASGPSWPTGTQIFTNSDESVALSLLAYKTHLLALFANANDHLVYRSSDAASWAASSTQLTANLLSNSVTAQERIDAGMLTTVAGEAVAAVWHEGNGTITFFSSTNAGDDWTDENVDIASGGGVKGLLAYRGVDDAIKLLVGTEEGLWEVDTSPSTWTMDLIYEMVPHADNCRGMTVHSDGAVWFGIGCDSSTPAGVVRYTAMSSARKFEVDEMFDASGNPIGVFLGPAAGDTCDATLLGPIRWWKSAGRLLFAAVGGGSANQTAWIMCHNGFGWHVFYYHDTANQKIDWIDVSSEDDGVVRLHHVNNPAASGHDPAFQTRPLSNPADGQAYTYYDGSSTPGTLHRPEFNLDMHDVSKNILNVAVEAFHLGTTSAEYENIDFGKDGVAATATDLGNIISGTTSLKFGSDAGVSAVSIAVAQNLFNKTNTGSTVFDKGLTIRMEPKFAILNGWELTVDIVATASLRRLSREAIITELEAIRDSVTMVTFQYSPKAQTYVTMADDSYTTDGYIASGVTTDTMTTQRKAIASFSLEER